MSNTRARVAELERLINETRTLFHHLKRAAEAVHESDALAAGARAVLIDLARLGPTTVPDLARMRPVSRQHIQLLVNPLLDQGLVGLAVNPRHQRSKLVRLTPKGRKLTERLRRREANVLADVVVDLQDVDLEQATATLQRVRNALPAVARKES